MTLLKATYQPLILTGAGIKPTVPTPNTLTPDDPAWDASTHIPIGGWAYNRSTDKFFYRSGGNTIEEIGGPSSRFTSNLGSLPMPNDFGGIQAGTTADDLEGLDHNQLWINAMFPTVLAIISINKQATITHNGQSGNIEVGTALNMNLTAGFNRGTILDGDKSTTHPLVGVPTDYTFTGTGISSTNQAGNTLAINVNAVEGDNDWDVVVAHNAGTDNYYDNKSNAGTNLDGFRSAGTASDTNASPNITGHFARFFGPLDSSPANSADVRSIGVILDTNNSLTLNTGSVETKFFIALPPGRTIQSAIDQDALNADITSSYISQGTLSVNDANGQAHTYNIYEMNIASPYSSNHRHLITITG